MRWQKQPYQGLVSNPFQDLLVSTSYRYCQPGFILIPLPFPWNYGDKAPRLSLTDFMGCGIKVNIFRPLRIEIDDP
jgi:hypothetical protein